MPKNTKAKMFIIEIGENMITPIEQVRAYFFYVTPTGQTQHIKDGGKVKQLSFAKGVLEHSLEGRLMKIAYEVLTQTIVLQMRCIRTGGGRIRTSQAFNFEVGDPDFPLVEIKGFQGFGYFKGHAKIEGQIPEGVTIAVVEPGKTDEHEPQMGLIW